METQTAAGAGTHLTYPRWTIPFAGSAGRRLFQSGRGIGLPVKHAILAAEMSINL